MPSPTLRRAEEADLPTVVRLFSIPDLGNAKNEDPGPPLPPCYAEALARIAGDPHNALMVAELDGAVVGAFHFTVIQYVANRGGRVAQVENVVVDPTLRSKGIGEAMMRWAIEEARARGGARVQLTSNVHRTDAHRFYERLGFVPGYVGMKLVL
jgi:ribosomal protein S18 acetylase RimI-like enzyme